MKRLIACAGFLLAFTVSGVPAQDAAPPSTAAGKYAALLKEQQAQARMAQLPQAFLDLAKEYPNDPVAVDALTQTVAMVNGTAFPPGGKDTPAETALAILQRDHLTSEKLGTVCQSVIFGFHQSYETFLRTVMEKNPHRDVQGLACLSLAQFLNTRMSRLELMPDQPAYAERYQNVFGKDYIAQLLRQDRAAVLKEVEALFDRAVENFPDVKIPVTYYGSGGTVGEKTKAVLFQIRHLAVGKEAPDIEGADQDGKRFKLSEYRGKVVLLDFWNHL